MKFPNISISEKQYFSERLKEALIENNISLKPSHLTRNYNLLAEGAPVTPHAARKWLVGEAIPTQEKILVLAKWLNVSAAWLRFGDADSSQYGSDGGPNEFTESDIYREMMDLTKPSKKVVKDLVKSLKQLEKAVIPHKGTEKN